MKALKYVLSGLAAWVATRRTTLLVWVAIFAIVFVMIAVNRSRSAAILANLTSTDPQVRNAQVVALARNGELASVLISTEDPTQEATSVVNVQSAKIRLAAADALVNDVSLLTPSQAFAAFYSLEKDTVTASDAVEGLSKLGASSSANLRELAAGLGDGDPDVRTAAVGALTKIGGSSVVSLASAQVKVAAAQDSAMATLAAVGKPAIEELTSLLLDTSTVEPLRETAAADLGQIGNPEAAAALESSASPSPPNPELRRVCLTSLASIVLTSVPNVTGIPAAKAPISGPRLVAQAKAEAPVLIASVLNTNDDSFARAREALALGRLATPAAINALVQTLASYDIRLASAAQSGIESVGDPAVSALSRAVIDQNQQVRQGAALALGVIGTTPALVAIRPAFSDTAPSVREAAASGLGRSKNPASMPILMAHLGDPDGSVASAISNSLHELGNPAVDGLIAALGSKNTSGSIPFFASQALSSDGQMSVSALLAASTTGTTNQKVWIAVTLGTMHDPNVVSGLKDLSNDSNARVKWAARQALEQYEGDS